MPQTMNSLSRASTLACVLSLTTSMSSAPAASSWRSLSSARCLSSALLLLLSAASSARRFRVSCTLHSLANLFPCLPPTSLCVHIYWVIRLVMRACIRCMCVSARICVVCMHVCMRVCARAPACAYGADIGRSSRQDCRPRRPPASRPTRYLAPPPLCDGRHCCYCRLFMCATAVLPPPCSWMQL